MPTRTFTPKRRPLFHAIANNHGFLEGNKRTAVLAVILFYNLNGWQVRVEQDQLVDFAVGAVVDHLDVPAIAKQLATWTLPFPP
jgi:death-on-curing protein